MHHLHPSVSPANLVKLDWVRDEKTVSKVQAAGICTSTQRPLPSGQAQELGELAGAVLGSRKPVREPGLTADSHAWAHCSQADVAMPLKLSPVCEASDACARFRGDARTGVSEHQCHEVATTTFIGRVAKHFRSHPGYFAAWLRCAIKLQRRMAPPFSVSHKWKTFASRFHLAVR